MYDITDKLYFQKNDQIVTGLFYQLHVNDFILENVKLQTSVSAVDFKQKLVPVLISLGYSTISETGQLYKLERIRSNLNESFDMKKLLKDFRFI